MLFTSRPAPNAVDAESGDALRFLLEAVHHGRSPESTSGHILRDEDDREAEMRALIQRVSRAEVFVDGEVIGSIGAGIVALLGVAQGDGDQAAANMAKKIREMRIFAGPDGKMNRSVAEAGGGVLVVSQFTLLADTSRGRRPSFAGAADPEMAEALIDKVVEGIRASGIPVEQGRFRAHMQVSLTNDGPVTILIDT